MPRRPRKLAVAMGDPSGVGPEVIIRALASSAWPGETLVFGDARWLETTRRALRIPRARFPGRRVTIVDVPLRAAVRRGHSSAASGAAALACVQAAVAAVERGEAAGLVTAPVSKAAVQQAGHWFPGHTEWLARRAGVRDVEMLLVGGGLRVVVVTRHVPLRRVPSLVTSARLRTALRLCAQSLRYDFGLRRPHIAVAGLNPHAGESGRIGREEGCLIMPVIRSFRAAGVRVTGPVSPDAVFTDARAGHYDAVIAMYHDQGLIPVKLLARDEGVNVTLGLPYVRTAPDHGTAVDIASRFHAHPGAMRAALELAWMLVRRRAR